jgi:hypothetical protein
MDGDGPPVAAVRLGDGDFRPTAPRWGQPDLGWYMEMRDRVSDFLRASGLVDQPDATFGVSPNIEWTDLPGGWSALFADRGDVRERVAAHLEGGEAPSEPKIATIQLDREPTYWIKRSRGEPAPLPEEVLSALIDRGGVPADRSLGAFRIVYATRLRGGGRWILDSEGVALVVPAEQMAGVFESIEEARPVDFPPGGGVAGIDYLRWRPVAEARDGGDERVPATAEELIAAYVEVVGIEPANSWGVFQGRADEPFVGVIYRSSSTTEAGRLGFAEYSKALGLDLGMTLEPGTIRMLGAHGAAEVKPAPLDSPPAGS